MLETVTVRRMLAALAAVLSFGTCVGAFAGDGEPAGYVALLVVVEWVLAGAIAGAVLLVVAAVRRGRPPRAAVAGALACGALLVWPVYAHFYDDPEFTFGTVGACEGLIPFAVAAENQLFDDTYVPFSYSAGCDD